MKSMLSVGWVFYPSVLLGTAAWTLSYVLLCGPLRGRHQWGKPPGAAQQLSFHAGTVITLLALVSPLDVLGDEYLFSAHMLQHLLFLFAVAPCWLGGIPGWLLSRALPGWAQRALRWLTQPISAAAIFAGVTLAWHHPAAYGLAQTNEWVHVVEHLTYIGAGLIGWWPITGPEASILPRPPVPVRLLYGFAIVLPCTLLGALFTFAGHPIYPFYANAPHPFGLGALEDQHLGGLLMWVPTHMIVLLVVGRIAAQWLESGARRTLAHQNLHR